MHLRLGEKGGSDISLTSDIRVYGNTTKEAAMSIQQIHNVPADAPSASHRGYYIKIEHQGGDKPQIILAITDGDPENAHMEPTGLQD